MARFGAVSLPGAVIDPDSRVGGGSGRPEMVRIGKGSA
jgi:hypothetical protein